MGSGAGRVTKKSNKRQRRKRALRKMVDQVHADVSDPLRAEALRNEQPVDFDLPGLGQIYCVECARYFASEDARATHVRTKVHKARVRELRHAPYTQDEADAAAGMGPTDNGRG